MIRLQDGRDNGQLPLYEKETGKQQRNLINKNMSLANIFLTSAIKRIKEYKALGDKTFAQLSDEQMLAQPNHSSNSIAVIIRHMHGNMLSRWTNFLTEDGEKEWRQRDAEFEEQPSTKRDLLQMWEEGWRFFLTALESLQEEDLLKTITIRTQPLLVVDAINRQMAHYSSHVGQIIYLGKWLKADDWHSLSIPKNGSGAYNQQLKQESLAKL
ncbi:MAG TPA: DUF1572 family protein [Flavisolibacter sp.]|nr:DUF1572 family protein [Flavisolibacter sp.]